MTEPKQCRCQVCGKMSRQWDNGCPYWVCSRDCKLKTHTPGNIQFAGVLIDSSQHYVVTGMNASGAEEILVYADDNDNAQKAFQMVKDGKFPAFAGYQTGRILKIQPLKVREYLMECPCCKGTGRTKPEVTQ